MSLCEFHPTFDLASKNPAAEAVDTGKLISLYWQDYDVWRTKSNQLTHGRQFCFFVSGKDGAAKSFGLFGGVRGGGRAPRGFGRPVPQSAPPPAAAPAIGGSGISRARKKFSLKLFRVSGVLPNNPHPPLQSRSVAETSISNTRHQFCLAQKQMPEIRWAK